MYRTIFLKIFLTKNVDLGESIWNLLLWEWTLSGKWAEAIMTIFSNHSYSQARIWTFLTYILMHFVLTTALGFNSGQEWIWPHRAKYFCKCGRGSYCWWRRWWVGHGWAKWIGRKLVKNIHSDSWAKHWNILLRLADFIRDQL